MTKQNAITVTVSYKSERTEAHRPGCRDIKRDSHGSEDFEVVNYDDLEEQVTTACFSYDEYVEGNIVGVDIAPCVKFNVATDDEIAEEIAVETTCRGKWSREDCFEDSISEKWHLCTSCTADRKVARIMGYTTRAQYDAALNLMEMDIAEDAADRQEQADREAVEAEELRLRHNTLARRTKRLAPKADGTGHCQQCGSTDVEDLEYNADQGYTGCCNERINIDCNDRDDCHHLDEYYETLEEIKEIERKLA